MLCVFCDFADRLVRRVVGAGEVAHVNEQTEVRVCNSRDELFDPVTVLRKKAVVLNHSRDALLCGIFGHSAAALNEGGQSLLKPAVSAKGRIIAAMFGSDANWGRVLCAIGYSGADVDVNKIDVWFKSDKGSILVCENGAGVDFSEEKAKEILSENEIDILVDLKSGDASSTAWGCDLTYDYVKINGDYRT